MPTPDFVKKWASSRPSIPEISSPDYALGFANYLGAIPPSTDDHDYIMNLQDERAVWLYENKANLASPAFTGTPTAPTPATGLRSTAIATMQKFADEFGSSLASNGYQKLPSGLIIQWGSSAPTATSVTVTFPIAFPNTVLRLLENDYSTVSSKTIWSASSVTNTGFTVDNLGKLIKGSTTFNAPITSSYPWLAIGY